MSHLSFPVHTPHRAAGRVAQADAEPTCTLWFVGRELGKADLSAPRLVAYIQGLVDQFHFPAPYPSLQRRTLTRAVTQRSTWRRAAVLAWLDDWLPPATAEALDAAARTAAAADMDAAAARLGTLRPLRLVGGSRA